MKTISVKTGKREEMLDITGEVRRALAEALSEENHPVGETPPPLLRKEGSLILFVQHTTCGLTVNENADPDVKSDMLGFLRRLIPQHDPEFKHYEHNSDAHIKASLMGPSLTVPFAGGELMLGRSASSERAPCGVTTALQEKSPTIIYDPTANIPARSTQMVCPRNTRNIAKKLSENFRVLSRVSRAIVSYITDTITCRSLGPSNSHR